MQAGPTMKLLLGASLTQRSSAIPNARILLFSLPLPTPSLLRIHAGDIHSAHDQLDVLWGKGYSAGDIVQVSLISRDWTGFSLPAFSTRQAAAERGSFL